MTAGLRHLGRCELDPERRDWDELAAVDPFWAVLTPSGGPTRHPKTTEFLASGRRIATHVLEDVRRLGAPQRLGRALDFGCGPGRVTRALADRFDESLGVDVSPVMIEEARRLNADVPRCRFATIVDPALSDLADGSFDLVHTRHVLEHAPRELVLDAHLPALVRVLAPGGLLVAGLPVSLRLRHRIGARRAAYRGLRRLGLSSSFLQERLGLHPIRMTAIPRETVELVLAKEGARLLEVRTGVGSTGIVKATYLATR